MQLMKVLLVVLGPFAFVFWWIIISHFGERNRAKRLIAERRQTGEDYTDADLRFLEQVSKPRHLRTLGVLLLSLAGSVRAALLSMKRVISYSSSECWQEYSARLSWSVRTRLLRTFMSENA